ncbi:MAG: N-ethylammeline chlorohydrolase [Alphaproteobacteria bacterium]|nr:N-ethylammeline chlorohydrolase [Alphaproteobacteria bacterium]
MSKTTLIKGADWAIVWDAGAKRHAYRRGADVAFAGDRVTFVGEGYEGAADVTLDGSGLMVMPGLVNLHIHSSNQMAYKGVREDHGTPDHQMTGLYERMQAFVISAAGKKAATELAYIELLQGGVTTVMDLTGDYPGWIETVAASGMRAYLAPQFASAGWYMDNPQEVKFAWDEGAGRQQFEAALALSDEIERHASGRLSPVIFPAQIDTVSEELFRDAIAVAKRTGRLMTTHIAQSVVEFREMIRRTGMSPVQWAEKIGLLGPRTVLGHAMFVDEHPAIRWHTRRDIAILAETGATVAHCPMPFALYGETLNHFGGYVARGVNLGMGTDMAPHNLLEEMRLALLLGRVASHDVYSVQARTLLDAATIAGSRALGRDDLGRLAPGAKADLVLVDLKHPGMVPARDPLRNLIHTAADRAVRDVYVDGSCVVKSGRATGLDGREAAGILEQEQARMLADARLHDYRHRHGDEISPLSLPML